MKSLLLLILGLMILTSVSAKEVYQYKKGDEIDQIVELLGGPIEPTVFCADDFKQFSTVNCASREKEAVNLFNSAHSMLMRMEFEIYDYSIRPEIQNDPKRARDLDKISKNVACIKEKMKDTDLVCQADDKACVAGAIAYVTTYLIPNPFKKNKAVNLCPVYWDTLDEYKSAVFIHEISHLCGTKDHEYFSGSGYVTGVPNEKKEVEKKFRLWPKSSKTKTVDIATSNADSYEFWAIRGFCLPGFDCEDKY